MRHEGINETDVVMERTIDMMYQGQWRSLAVPVGTPVGPITDLVAAFHAQHAREYNFRRDDAPVDFYRLNLRSIGVVPKASLRERIAGGRRLSPIERRATWFEGKDSVETLVYRRDDLSPGSRFDGPAIVEQLDSTTVVPPGFSAEVDRFLNIILRVGG
jgi:N-methylhydantoinase A